MKMVVVPKLLHEVFGERQHLSQMIAIVLVGAAVPALLFVTGSVPEGLALWRLLVAVVLLFDIAAGAVANFTRGTNAHYKGSPRRRIVFIAVHWHLVVLFAALGYELLPAVVITAYTLGASFWVQRSYGGQGQPVLGAALVVSGIAALVLLEMPPFASIVATIFLVKLVLGFAVDHYSAHHEIVAEERS